MVRGVHVTVPLTEPKIGHVYELLDELEAKELLSAFAVIGNVRSEDGHRASRPLRPASASVEAAGDSRLVARLRNAVGDVCVRVSRPE